MGIGSVLIDAATTYLTEEGARQAFLYTDTDCTWQFYEHHGFKRAGTYRSTREERRLLPARCTCTDWTSPPRIGVAVL